MGVKYILRTDMTKDKEGNSNIVYGITAINHNMEVLETYSGVFLDIQKAMVFVKLCNSEKLELVHLRNVIEDILS